MKLPWQIIIRLKDLIVYSQLNQNDQASVKAYRIEVKRRLYLRCMSVYAELFKNSKDQVVPRTRGLASAYLYNDLLENDQFAKNVGEEEEGAEAMKAHNAEMDALTQEGVKM